MVRIRQRSAGVLVACALAVGPAIVGTPLAVAADRGSVSGLVTADGAPLAAAWVVLTPVTASGDWAGKPMQVATGSDGHYAFVAVAAEHVKVHVRSPLTGNHVATFWPGVYSFGQAGTIPVLPEGSVADIDLPAGRSIQGQVVAADTGEPIEGARLVARLADAPWAEPVGRFERGAGPGRFEVGGLPPVPIRLHVQVPTSSPFLGDGYGAEDTEPGRRVDEPGDVTGLVIRLPRGGEVSGTVRDGRGLPVSGAVVRIEKCQVGCPRDATTDESGVYRVRGVAPSPRMIAHAWAPGAIDQWYDHAGDWIAATPLALGPGEVRTGVDFTLITGGTLVGTVIAADTGLPLAGVPAYLQSIAEPVRRYFATFSVAAPGSYRIGPVPPDTYRLVLLPNARQSRYRPARWFSATGIPLSGVVRLDPGLELEVEVRLARAPTFGSTAPSTGAAGTSPGTPADCAVGAGAWVGLYRGFLSDDPWPRPASPPGDRGRIPAQSCAQRD